MYIPGDVGFINRPQWRWNRILELLNNRESAGVDGQVIDTDVSKMCVPTPPRDDRYVVTGYRFLRELRQADGNNIKERVVAQRYRALYEAYMLKMQANQRTQDAVEALITANAKVEDISENIGASVGAIEWYKRMWFDLGKKPITRLQVATVLVPNAHAEGFSAHDTGGYWKILGSMSLNMLWDTMEMHVSRGDELIIHRDVFRSLTQASALKAIMTLPVNSFTAPTILETYSTLEKNYADAEAATGVGQKLTGMMELVLKGAHWAVMEAGKKIPEFIHDSTTKMIESAPRSQQNETSK